ncbi:hypothetical protein [Erythrobacter sp. JK5]|uniref:hypothetical protein n=1 Tax=Erythrobacter sp. JK5 TaxID=2829500 RepID=UPI001BA95377|nr:hypothetical protein [Erythrobacter sp. JK5]QUL38084.1 hypothetical protein KDC96_01255 [Erythrobacter sp. JK5]
MIDALFVEPTLVIAATCLVGLCVVAFALLRGWQGWLELKRQELDRAGHSGPAEIEGGAGVGAARIELADLKERIRKLEAIASGVEL